MRTNFSDRRYFRIQGFSLVEVTLAIGIISFALLSIVGTMSVGLTTVRESQKDTSHAQIAARINAAIVQTSFTNQTPLAASGPFYFDQSGRQLEKFDQATALFQARIEPVQQGAAYPGAPQDMLNDSAKKWNVTISSLRPGTTNAISSSRTVLLIPKS